MESSRPFSPGPSAMSPALQPITHKLFSVPLHVAGTSPGMLASAAPASPHSIALTSVTPPLMSAVPAAAAAAVDDAAKPGK